MEFIFLYIKHHLSFLWRFIEWCNGVIFSLFYRGKMENTIDEVFEDFAIEHVTYKRLNSSNIVALFDLISGQNSADLDYFHPHAFDLNSIGKQLKKPAFLMMGAFSGNKLVGYFFLRFFLNKKCFVGRIIDSEYRGKGIGLIMNKIMYETSWRMGFHCLSTISLNNTLVMKAHSRNPTMVILKKLQNDYLLVEFLKDKNVSKTNI
jgi:hypothetical protein